MSAVVASFVVGCSDDDASTEPIEQVDSGGEAATTSTGETDGGDGSTEAAEPTAEISGVSSGAWDPSDDLRLWSRIAARGTLSGVAASPTSAFEE